MSNLSNWSIVSVQSDIIKIIDLDQGGRSVTNDAESVVRELYDRYGDRRFVYRDSEGQWDELKHNHGVFTHFAPWKQEAKP